MRTNLLKPAARIWAKCNSVRLPVKLILVTLFFIAFQARAQEIEWDKTFGSNGEEAIIALQQTSDGGYILGGWSDSDNQFGDKTERTRGETDYWVVKVDAAGNKQWDRTFGGSSYDELTSLQQTSDGGYILGGYSYSGISGDKTEASRGESDFWVVKIDAAGNKQWDRTFGGNNFEGIKSLQQTTDGGYILGGSSSSDISGDKTDPNRGDCEDFDGFMFCTSDYWVVKLDAAGNKEWDRTFGGFDYEDISSLQQTTDGGYILGGTSDSNSSGDKSEPSRGESDFWVVKIDAAGNKQWDRTFGGDDSDGLNSLQQTSDNGYILGGFSFSGVSGDKTVPNNGKCEPWCATDYWVVKLDASGNMEWDRTFGGNGFESVRSLQQTTDGGYILGGSSSSDISGDKTEANRGDCEYFDNVEQCSADYWVVKVDAAGNKQWDRTFGGSSYDELTSLQQTGDGGYILGGASMSGISGDKSEESRGPGGPDFWIVKLSGDTPCGNGKVLLCHNGQTTCVAPSAVDAHLRNHPEDRLGTCGVITVMEQATAIRVYPNPMTTRADVELSIPKGQAYQLELYNAGGKQLGIIAEGLSPDGGMVQLQLRTENLQKGVYYLRLVTTDKAEAFRIVINK